MSEAHSVCSLGATLGEGALWVPEDGAVWFVDIKQHRIHRFDPATSALKSWDTPAQVGWVLPCADGGMMCGLKTGLYRFDPAASSFTLITAVEPDLPGNRLNDATCDSRGRLWMGSMDDGEKQPTGHFYRADASGIARIVSNIAITNGPAVSPDATQLYYTDTLAGIIHVASIGDDGTLSDRRIFARIDPADGHPDGPSVDAEGCVWTALWGGAAVRRYSPAGEILRTCASPPPTSPRSHLAARTA